MLGATHHFISFVGNLKSYCQFCMHMSYAPVPITCNPYAAMQCFSRNLKHWTLRLYQNTSTLSYSAPSSRKLDCQLMILWGIASEGEGHLLTYKLAFQEKLSCNWFCCPQMHVFSTYAYPYCLRPNICPGSGVLSVSRGLFLSVCSCTSLFLQTVKYDLW